MSTSSDSNVVDTNTGTTVPQDKDLVIEIDSINENQKKLLIVTIISFIVQIIYLTNIQLITGLLKPFIAQSYNPVADYVKSFLDTFVPYLIVLFFFLMLYFMYVFLVEDKETLEILYDSFDYVGLGVVILLVIFFISVFTIPTLPLTALYPNVVELILFALVVLASAFIALVPFGIKKYLVPKAKLLT